MTRMSSAYPMGWHPWSVSRCNSSSSTRLHSKGDSTPPYGHPDSKIPRRVVFPLVIAIFLFPSTWQVQSTTAMGTPGLIVSLLITSLHVWLKAPSISKNIPIANLLRFSWSQILRGRPSVLACFRYKNNPYPSSSFCDVTQDQTGTSKSY